MAKIVAKKHNCENHKVLEMDCYPFVWVKLLKSVIPPILIVEWEMLYLSCGKMTLMITWEQEI